MKKIHSEEFLVEVGSPADLQNLQTNINPIDERTNERGERQILLYNSDQYSVMLLVQGIDAVGKESVINRVIFAIIHKVVSFITSPPDFLGDSR